MPSSTNPKFPTGLSWKKAKQRARKLKRKTPDVRYTEALVRIAEDNAVVLPSVDKIRDWLEKKQPILREIEVKYLTPKQLRELNREQLFVLTYELHHDQKVWFYCHVVPCSACQHDNHGMIDKSDAWDCMECSGRGFKVWPARVRSYDLNQKLLTPAMQRRLKATSDKPTARRMAEDFFPSFVERTSEIGQELRDKVDRDFPEIAYNGQGSEESDNPDIYEDPLFS